MSRAERLLALLQLLRNHRYPVTGVALAAQLGISLRTLYRDIASLQQQGAHIEGEAGMGYVLRSGFTLPPLMFDTDELEALVLGARWVVKRGDERLSDAAQQALHKINAVLPNDKRHLLDAASLFPVPQTPPPSNDIAALLRDAIRDERKIILHYCDAKQQHSTRPVWPIAVGYFDAVNVLVAWCELRQGFRHFRHDRIISVIRSDSAYPIRRAALLKRWQSEQGIVLDAFSADKN